MKIIFLNTWHSTMRDELYSYVKSQLDTTDVFCFQESLVEDRTLYEDLFRDKFVVHAAQREYEDIDVGYGNAMYIRRSIPLTETGVIFEDDTAALHIGQAVYATISVEGVPVTICNVHGIPYPGDKLDSPTRLLQSRTIIEAFAERQAVIIGGDFNLLPDTKSIQVFSEAGYADLIRDYKIPTTRNKITFDRFPDNIQYHADYAFVSPAIQVKNFSVPSEVVSDHQPLELEVIVRGNEYSASVSNKISHEEAVSA